MSSSYIEDEHPSITNALLPFAVFELEGAYFIGWGNRRLNIIEAWGETVSDKICCAMMLRTIDQIASWKSRFDAERLVDTDPKCCIDPNILRVMKEMTTMYNYRVIVFAKRGGFRRVIDVNRGGTKDIKRNTDIEDADLFLFCCGDEVMFAQKAVEL